MSTSEGFCDTYGDGARQCLDPRVAERFLRPCRPHLV